MTKGNLTLYLSLQDSPFSTERILSHCLEEIPKEGSFYFVGFSSEEIKKISKTLPASSPVKFVDFNKDFFSSGHKVLFNLAPKLVVFRHLIYPPDFNRSLKLITHLVESGVDVFTTSSLSYFSETQKRKKKTDRSLNCVPPSFYRHISRTIVLPSQNDPEGNEKDLFSTALALSTHIKHENFKSMHSFSRSSPTNNKHSYKDFPPLLDGLNAFLAFSKNKKNKTIKFLYETFCGALGPFLSLFATKCLPIVTPCYESKVFIVLTSISALLTYRFFNFFTATVSIVISFFLSLSFICNSLETSYMGQLVISVCLLIIFLCFSHISLLSKSTKYQLKAKLKNLTALFYYTETLSSCVNEEGLIKASKQYFKETFEVDIVLLLNNQLNSKLDFCLFTSLSSHPEKDSLNSIEKNTYADYDFLPLIADSVTFGHIGLKYTDLSKQIDEVLLNASILQLKLSLQRLRLSTSYQSAVLEHEKEQLRSVILSSISHDLKTPLTTIIGSCTAIEELPNLSEENRVSLIRGIHEASEHLNQSISNILESSKLSTDNLLRRNTFVYLDDIINSLLQRMKRSLRLLKVTVNIPAPEKAILQGDPTLIQQVFFNLIDNATKHTPIGGEIIIHITTSPDLLTAKVIDNGPGVETSRRKVIFDKFYRFQHADYKQAGTGLGLAICKQIIEAHKGKIWISDRDDMKKGAQFNVDLPSSHENYI